MMLQLSSLQSTCLNITQHKLDQEDELTKRMNLAAQHIIKPMEFCHHNAYLNSRVSIITKWSGGHGIPGKPHSSKHIHGTF